MCPDGGRRGGREAEAAEGTLRQPYLLMNAQRDVFEGREVVSNEIQMESEQLNDEAEEWKVQDKRNADNDVVRYAVVPAVSLKKRPSVRTAHTVRHKNVSV